MTDVAHVHPPHGKTQPWVYAVGIGVGGIALLYWYRSNKAAGAASAATVDTSSGYPVLTSDPLGSSGGGNSTGSGSADYSTQSNSAWEAQAIAWLVTQGKNPLTAQSALENYLAGNPLSASDGALVSLVVGKFGVPPQGSAGPPIVAAAPAPATPAPVSVSTPVKTPVPVAPKPAPAPHITTVAPPAQASPYLATYEVKPGDTLSAIALHYYGHATPFYYLKIATANGIVNPNLIHPGQVLRIPR